MSARISPKHSSGSTPLSARAAAVLRGVVIGFLRTGEPVASDAAVRYGRLDVSSATARVVMGELTALGLVHKPHASAGRVPTESGMRVYVDHLLRIRGPSAADRGALTATLQAAGGSPLDLVRAATRHLAGVCAVTVVGRRPRVRDALVERIELVRLDARRVLTVCVFAGGEVRDGVVRLDEPLDDALLVRLRNLFAERWSGRPLDDVRRALRAELAQADRRDPRRRLLELGQQVLPPAETPDESVVVEGRTHLLGRPDDHTRLHAVLRALDDKRLLLQLLDEISTAGPQVVFGGETPHGALRDCSVVAAPYRDGTRTVGALAIVGPVRMNYSRIIPWVGYTADAISGVLHATRAA